MTEDPQKEIDRLTKKVTELTDDVKRLRSYLRTFQDDASQVGYLQLQILRLERQYAEQQSVINQYQAHYSKWGKFYTSYAQEHSLDVPTPL